MSTRNVLIIALRIGSIILALNAIEGIPYYYGSFETTEGFSWYLFGGTFVVPFMIKLFFAGAMWFYPNLLLNKVFVRDEESPGERLDFEEFGPIAISIVGLYILVGAITDIVYFGTLFRVARYQLGNLWEIPPQEIAGLTASVFELVLGTVVIFGSRSVNLLIQRLQKELKG